MSRGYPRRQRSSQSFPRVSGDEPTRHMLSVSSARFSPRERG